MATKIIFFGTHDFAAGILSGLLGNPEFSVELVITQPDKPTGRKQEIQKSSVKLLAEKNNIKVEQPESLKKYNLKPNTYKLGVCAQYGLIIPQHILNTPELGVLNVHTSLLPKYRGASPVQMALVNGEIETGITIMKMDAGMDTGPILLQKSVEIAPDDTYPILSQKLAKIANSALTEAISGYISGKIESQPQNDKDSTYTKILTREDGCVDWSRPAQEIYNQYRGLTPWPGVWTVLNGKRLKLLKIKPVKKDVGKCKFILENDSIYVGCDKDSIEVLELQMEGSKPMNARQFMNGYKNLNNSMLC